MSDDLVRARARVAAGEWLARKEQEVPPPPKISLPLDGFRAFMLEAFMDGYAERIHVDVLSGDELALTATVLDAASRGEAFTKSDAARAAKAVLEARDRIERLIKGQAMMTDERAIERATGQRQLDDATALMTEAAELLRGYEAHHRAKAEQDGAVPGATEKADRNALMAARLEAWLRGEDQYPVSVCAMMSSIDEISTLPGTPHQIGAVTVGVVAERPDDAHPGFAEGGFVKEGPSVDVPALCPGGVDYLDSPVEISAINGPPMREPDVLATLNQKPPTLAEERATACAAAGFIPWGGGDGPPADWDGGDFLLDWGSETRSEPRFTVCRPEDCSPDPGLWAADRDPSSYATIIGYRTKEYREPISTPRVRAKGVVTDLEQTITWEGEGHDLTQPIRLNGVLYAPAEPEPLAALVSARNWLMSAEQLIAAAAEHIRGVTGALPGSDSAELCARLDAWLCPLATRPADEGAEKDARRSSSTHQGD